MKALWEEIAKVLAENGCVVTGTQVQDKFKALTKSFKRCIAKKKKTGHGYITCDFFDELSEIFRGKVNIHTLILSGNMGTEIRHDNIAQSGENEITDISENNEISEIEEINVDDPANDTVTVSTPVSSSLSSIESRDGSIRLPTGYKNCLRLSVTAKSLLSVDEEMKKFATTAQERNIKREEFEKKISDMLEKEIDSAKNYREENLYLKRRKLDVLEKLLDKL